MKTLEHLLISTEDFCKLRDVIYKNFGINLTDAKKKLVESRLNSVLRKYNFSTFKEYYDYIIADKNGLALSELVNKISTNFTYFYREEKHFEFFINTVLKQILESLAESKSNDIRIWSAGCSSGEEPYTIIMLMLDALKEKYKALNAGILATDISEEALSIAEKGLYTKDKFEKMPKNLISKFVKSVDNEQYEISDVVKKEIVFRRFNLMNDVFPFKKQFHVIFCRNVMIYFDEITRKKLVNKYIDLLVPGGYLFIGHSESLGRNIDQLEYVMPAVYRKV